MHINLYYAGPCVHGYMGFGGAWLVYTCANGKGRTETATFDGLEVDMKQGYSGGP